MQARYAKGVWESGTDKEGTLNIGKPGPEEANGRKRKVNNGET